jgi:hypothetical protein
MELTKADLPYFAAFVLLDEAWRLPSGKRQTARMKGFWLCGQIRPGMRLSDRLFRSKICIEAFRRVGGMSISKAAAAVAAYRIGEGRAAKVEVLRAAYYENRAGELNWDFFFGQFLLCRDWVLQLTDDALDRLLEDYQRSYGQPRRRRLADWIKRLREDSAQRTRHESWLREVAQLAKERIESNRGNPERDWQMLATDCWQAGRLQAQFEEIGEAKAFLQRALSIWQTHGHKLSHMQVRAIAGLQDQLAQLAVRANQVNS